MIKHKNSGDKIFESYSHSNTRIKPEFLLNIMSSQQQQQQNNFSKNETNNKNIFTNLKQINYYSNNIQTELSKNVENYGREHSIQNVDWIKYHNQNYQQQYYYHLGYTKNNSQFQNKKNNSQQHHYRIHNHLFDTYNNYKNQNLSFIQKLDKKYNRYNLNIKNNNNINNNINLLPKKNLFQKNLRRENRLYREEVFKFFFYNFIKKFFF